MFYVKSQLLPVIRQDSGRGKFTCQQRLPQQHTEHAGFLTLTNVTFT